MGRGERPVSDREFKKVLRYLGYSPLPRTGTSHEKWVKDGRLVVVDSHHQPYHRKLLKLMLAQAGISKRDFFALLDRL